MIIPLATKQKIEKILELKPYSLRIITFSGKEGSGKDTYASIIQKLTNSPIIRFSDPVRKDFEDAGISNTQLDSLKRTNDVKFNEGFKVGGHDVSGLTVRDALIKVAETNKQNLGEYYYANIVLNKITEYISDRKVPGTVIIPDLRFEVEREALDTLMLMDRVMWIHFDITDNKNEPRSNANYYNYNLEPVTYI